MSASHPATNTSFFLCMHILWWYEVDCWNPCWRIYTAQGSTACFENVMKLSIKRRRTDNPGGRHNPVFRLYKVLVVPVTTL